MSFQNQLTNGTKPLTTTPLVSLQRSCDCGRHNHCETECSSCREERSIGLHRSAINRNRSRPPQQGVPRIVHETLRSPGQPLGATTFEPRFGRHFSRTAVRTLGLSRNLSIGVQDDLAEIEAARR